jgi:hypothetical protein
MSWLAEYNLRYSPSCLGGGLQYDTLNPSCNRWNARSASLTNDRPFLGHYNFDVVQDIKEMSREFNLNPYPGQLFIYDYHDLGERFYITTQRRLGVDDPKMVAEVADFGTTATDHELEDLLQCLQEIPFDSDEEDGAEPIAQAEARQDEPACRPDCAEAHALVPTSLCPRLLQTFGIRRMNSTCHFNVLVQLFLVIGLENALRDKHPAQLTPVVVALRQLMVDFAGISPEQREARVLFVLQSMQISPSQQHDPHEVLSTILAELVRSKVSIQSLVAMTRSERSCRSVSCGARSDQYEESCVVIFHLPDVPFISLQDLIDRNLVVEDYIADTRCPACSLLGVDHRIHLISTPLYLLAFLPRAKHNCTSFNLCNVALSRLVRVRGEEYSVQAVVFFSGTSPTSGHYTIMRFDKGVFCDDAVVVEDASSCAEVDGTGYKVSHKAVLILFARLGVPSDPQAGVHFNSSHAHQDSATARHRRTPGLRESFVPSGAIAAGPSTSMPASGAQLATRQGLPFPASLALDAAEKRKFHRLALAAGSATPQYRRFHMIAEQFNSSASGQCLTPSTARHHLEEAHRDMNRRQTLQPHRAAIAALRTSLNQQTSDAPQLADGCILPVSGPPQPSTHASIVGWRRNTTERRQPNRCRSCGWMRSAPWHHRPVGGSRSLCQLGLCYPQLADTVPHLTKDQRPSWTAQEAANQAYRDFLKSSSGTEHGGLEPKRPKRSRPSRAKRPKDLA